MHSSSITSALLLLAASLPLGLTAPIDVTDVSSTTTKCPYGYSPPNVYLLKVKSVDAEKKHLKHRYLGIRESKSTSPPFPSMVGALLTIIVAQKGPVFSLRHKHDATQVHFIHQKQHFVYGNASSEDWSMVLARDNSTSKLSLLELSILA